jgi:hypothetical protein
MELINEIQIEVTQVIIKKNNLLNRRDICLFKRTIFISKILSVSEENYLVENNYAKCSAIHLFDEGWIKIKEPYQELATMHSEWFNANINKSEENNT